MSEVYMPIMKRSAKNERAARKAVLHAAKKYFNIAEDMSEEERAGLFLSIQYIEQGAG